MSRNGSGTMSVVNTLVSGTAITAAAHNQNYSDIASELTNSLALDGQSTMTGPFKAASGTAAAPGQSFGSDTDSGWYRIGSNNIGAAVGGAKVLDVSADGLDVTGTLDATAITLGGASIIPVGLGPLPWSGNTAPSLWVLAGATYSRTTYAALWAFANTQIGLGNTFYGVGDGTTTFTIGTMDGYAPVGVDAAGTTLGSVTVVGATTGNKEITLAANQVPSLTSVNATQSLGGFVPIVNTGWSGQNVTSSGGSVAPLPTGLANITGASTINVSVAYTNASQQTTSVVQPSRAFKFIVYAGV